MDFGSWFKTSCMQMLKNSYIDCIHNFSILNICAGKKKLIINYKFEFVGGTVETYISSSISMIEG